MVEIFLRILLPMVFLLVVPAVLVVFLVKLLVLTAPTMLLLMLAGFWPIFLKMVVERALFFMESQSDVKVMLVLRMTEPAVELEMMEVEVECLSLVSP